MRTFLAGVTIGAGLMGAVQAARSERFPQFENAQVKVWRTLIAPHSRTEMHRHDHARVAVALSSGTITFVDDQGRSEQHAWQAGKAYWLTPMPPGTTHADVNEGDQPIEVMMVELQKN